jgi:hypothetical protein
LGLNITSLLDSSDQVLRKRNVHTEKLRLWALNFAKITVEPMVSVQHVPDIRHQDGALQPPPPPPPPPPPRPGFYRFPDVELSGKIFRR